MSTLVQGVLLGRLLKRFSAQRLAVWGLVSSTLAFAFWGWVPEGWMMYVVIIANVLGPAVAASLQSLVSRAADHHNQGQTLGAMSGLSSLMAVIAPAHRAGLRRTAAGPGQPLSGRRLAPWRADVLLRSVAGVCAAAGRLAFPARSATASSRSHGRTRGRAGTDRAGTDRSLNTMHDKILILDFGSQVTQLIARRVRESHVYCEIHPNDVSDAFIRDFAPKGIILSGSHASTYEAHDLRAPQAVWDLGVPVLGICYGMFTMVVQQGGQVQASAHREFGYAEVRAHGHTKLLRGIQDFATPEGHGMLKVWMSHGDKVTALPPGFKLMASTPSCPIAGMADEARGPTRPAATTPCSSTPRSRTRCRARPCWAASCTTSAAPAVTGSCATTSPKRWHSSGNRSATKRSSWA